MKDPGRTQSPRKGRLLVTSTFLAVALLFVWAGDRLPEPFARAIPGVPHLAQAEETNTSKAAPEGDVKPRNEVIVYMTSWCPACKMTLDYLRGKNIPFVAKDVEKNEQYMKEMVKKVGGYRGVPVLDINGKIMLGFNPRVLDQLAK